MFKEFEERIKNANTVFRDLKVDMKTTDWKSIANDPDEVAVMHKFYFDTVQNIYEGALGWIVTAKLGYIAMDEMNKIRGYKITTTKGDELGSLFREFERIADKNMNRLGKSVGRMECKNEVMSLFNGGNRNSNKRGYLTRII